MRLVLLHALPFDGGMWRSERDVLPDRTVAPSLYRFGTTLEQWAEGVLSLVADGPLVVVGCSAGGSCALDVARAAPERVEGMCDYVNLERPAEFRALLANTVRRLSGHP